MYPASIRKSVSLACVLSFAGMVSCGGGASSVIGGPRKGAEVLYAAFVTPNGGGPGGTIVPMSLNTSSGALTALSPVVGPGNAVKIVVDSSRTSLYSSDFNTGMLYAYSIHPASGNLTPS